MTIEGELVVRLERSERTVRRVTVRSTRPHAASRVALGRMPADAAATIPSLFGICMHAQGAAAAMALEAATGSDAPSGTIGAREMAVLLETVQEYLWRLLVDWPQAEGHAGEIEPVAAARRLLAPELARLAPLARRIAGGGTATQGMPPAAGSKSALALASPMAPLIALADRHVFGMPPPAWLELRDHRDVVTWAARGATLPARLLGELIAESPALGRSDVALMPAAHRSVLVSVVATAMRSVADFERAPTWSGAPAETGALARMREQPIVASFLDDYGNAVPTRMVARLAELAQLLGRLGGGSEGTAPPTAAHRTGDGARWVDGIALDGGEGLAAVQTARGLLLHRARVTDGRVSEYQIVAPTEWNFHPEGALVRGLEGAPAGDDAALARNARLLVQALDPCVACRVEVAGA